MTANTKEQERADFEGWARDRYPSIDLTREGDDYRMALAKDYWSLWQAARRAPAVTQFNHAAKRKLEWLTSEGAVITGYAFQNEGRRGSIDCHGFVAWWPQTGCSVPNGETPAAPVPQGYRLVPEESTESMARAFRADDAPYYFAMTTIRCNDFAERYRAMLAAAPQPPDAFQTNVAAPVQLPEPQAEIEVRSMKTYLDLSIHEWRDTLPDGTYNVYTEQQVRQLLATAKEAPC